MWQEPCQLPIKGERSGIKGEIFGSSIEEIFPVFSDVGALTSLAGVCHMFMGALKAWRNCVFWSIEGLFSPIEPGAPLPEGGWSSGLSVLGERASLEAAGRSRPEGEGRSRLEVSNVVGRSAQSGTSELQRSDLASNLWIDAAFNTLRNRSGRTRHGCIVHASSYGCAKCLFWEKQNLRLIWPHDEEYEINNESERTQAWRKSQHSNKKTFLLLGSATETNQIFTGRGFVEYALH